VGVDLEVKVLDFGLAKSIRQSHEAPAKDTTLTISSNLTGKATIIGTAPYMSPEQAAGKDLDARTDIWAFGCILYDGLTGRRAFVGESTTEILTAVIEREPDWSKLPDGTPAPLESLLRRCLRKDARAQLEERRWLLLPGWRPAERERHSSRLAVIEMACRAI
jgi:serine/threonine protein kinase